MHKFSLTDDAVQVAFEALAENGHLKLRIERPSKNVLQLSLWKDELKVMDMDPATVFVGDIFEINGLECKLNITAWSTT